MAERRALEAGKTIGSFKVAHELKRDAYGIYYSAEDSGAGSAVVVRECFPAGLAKRKDGEGDIVANDDFAAKRLKSLTDQSLRYFSKYASLRTWGFVPEREYFHENETIYQVWNEPKGQPLSEVFQAGERTTQAELKDSLSACLTSLNRLHGWGFVHAALTPDDIYRLEDGAIELGFPELALAEAARKAFPSDEEIDVTVYAAPEQVDKSVGQTDAKTDLYSLAACFYYLITSKVPASAQERLAARASNAKDPLDLTLLKTELADKTFVEVLASALSLEPSKRPVSATVFQTLLTGGTGGRPLSLGSTIREPKPKFPMAIVGGILGAVLVGGLGWWAYSNFIMNDDTPTETLAQSDEQGFTRPVVGETEPDAPTRSEPLPPPQSSAPATETEVADEEQASEPPPEQSEASSPVRTAPSAPNRSPDGTLSAEEQAWQTASSADTWWSYRVYLQSYGPDSANPGEHADEARALYQERGDERAANVLAARQLLSQLGYDVPVGSSSMDGNLSRQIAEFQRSNDLTVNGDATSDLVAALRAAAEN